MLMFASFVGTTVLSAFITFIIAGQCFSEEGLFNEAINFRLFG